MKTEPMSQQVEALERMEDRREFGLFCEQGTGKTWMLLADAERCFLAGKIDSLLVIAPKGVHVNWLKREAASHLSVDWAGCWWTPTGKARHKAVTELIESKTDALKIYTVNIEALRTKKAYNFVFAMLEHNRCYVVLDESSRIKTPGSIRTKKAIDLGGYGVIRRIASGTPVTQAPPDLFSQFEFLAQGKGLLGTTSYKAFVATYAELEGEHSPAMIAASSRGRGRFRPPQIVAKDENGRPIWKNLKHLNKIIKPHTYRVLKKDCLDLPDKIYQKQGIPYT